MSHRSLLLGAVLSLIVTSAAHAGPPWISVELPSNPHHASTRSAALLVRAYHHSTSINVPVRGVAEGIVNGKRVSMPLEVAATNMTGVFAVKTPLPKGGTWILALTLTQSEEITATALVTVNSAGTIVGVDVPSNRSRDGWSVPRSVDKREIEAALRSAHVAFGGEQQKSGWTYAYALPLLFAGLALAAVRRRQAND